jgi:hypothetical protein
LIADAESHVPHETVMEMNDHLAGPVDLSRLAADRGRGRRAAGQQAEIEAESVAMTSLFFVIAPS